MTPSTFIRRIRFARSTILRPWRFLPAIRWRGVAATPTTPPLPSHLQPIVLAPGAVIVCEGDSLTQGVDRIESLAGMFARRLPDTPYPIRLAIALGERVTVANYGKGGDTAHDALLRWQGKPSGDLAIIMFGGNDAKMRKGGVGATPIEAYREAMTALIRRRQRDGAIVLVMASPQVGFTAAEEAIAPYRIVARAAALATGALFVDAREFLLGETVPLKLDAIHLRRSASRAIGDGLAALIDVRTDDCKIRAQRVGDGLLHRAAPGGPGQDGFVAVPRGQ